MHLLVCAKLSLSFFFYIFIYFLSKIFIFINVGLLMLFPCREKETCSSQHSCLLPLPFLLVLINNCSVPWGLSLIKRLKKNPSGISRNDIFLFLNLNVVLRFILQCFFFYGALLMIKFISERFGCWFYANVRFFNIGNKTLDVLLIHALLRVW